MNDRTPIREEVDVSLQVWRETATHVVLLVMVGIGLPVVVYAIAEKSFPLPWQAQWIGVSVYGAVVAAACLRRQHYRWRTAILIVSLYTLSVVQLLLTGLVGGGRIALLALPLLALILLGVRAGWITAVVSSLLLAGFILLASNGILERWMVIHENSVLPGVWLMQELLLMGALIPLMILLTRFLNLQMQTMAAERQARRARDNFSRQLITTQENERRRIAGELHDGLGQDLLVIANQAQLGLSKAGHSPDTLARLTEIAEMAKQALQQARRMAHNLRPGLLEELGLTEAIEASAEKTAQASGMSMKLSLANVDGLLSPEFEVNLFRIVQEALNNILKHAAASEAKISLAQDASVLRLVVEDNGRGFDPALLQRTGRDQRGLGMQQIAERAGMMGGRLHLQSRPGFGTRLMVEVPVNES